MTAAQTTRTDALSSPLKYTRYLLFIHRERFLRVYSLKWMCAPRELRRYENARINTRHFVRLEASDPL